MRYRRNLGFGSRNRNHWQRVVTRTTQHADALKVCDVGIIREVIIDDDCINVAVVSQPIKQDSKFRINALQSSRGERSI